MIIKHIDALHTLQAGTTASLNALLNRQLLIQIQGIRLINKQLIQPTQLVPDTPAIQAVKALQL